MSDMFDYIIRDLDAMYELYKKDGITHSVCTWVKEDDKLVAVNRYGYEIFGIRMKEAVK